MSSIFVHKADSSAVTDAFLSSSSASTTAVAFSSDDPSEVVDNLTSSQLTSALDTSSSSTVFADCSVVIASESDDCGDIGMAVPLLVMAVVKHASEHQQKVLLHVYGIECSSSSSDNSNSSTNARCMLFDESSSMGQPQPPRFWNHTAAGLVVEPVDSVIISSPDEVEGIFENNVHYSDMEHLCCECLLLPAAAADDSKLLLNQLQARVTITCLYMGSNPSGEIFSSEENNTSSSSSILNAVLLRSSLTAPTLAICSLSSSGEEATKRLELVSNIVSSSSSSASNNTSSSSTTFSSKLERVEQEIQKFQQQNVVPSWPASRSGNTTTGGGDLFMEHLLIRHYFNKCEIQPGKVINFSQLSDQMIDEWKKHRQELLRVAAAEQQQRREEEEEKERQQAKEKADQEEQEQEEANKKKQQEEEEQERQAKLRQEQEQQQQREQQEREKQEKEQQQQREEAAALQQQREEDERQAKEEEQQQKKKQLEKEKEEEEQKRRKREEEEEKEKEKEKRKREQEEKEKEALAAQQQKEKEEQEQQRQQKEKEEKAAAQEKSPSPHSPIRGMAIWNNNENTATTGAAASSSSSSTATSTTNKDDQQQQHHHQKRKLQEAAPQLESDAAAKTTDEHAHLKNLYKNATTTVGGGSGFNNNNNNNYSTSSGNNNNKGGSSSSSSSVSHEVSKSSSIVSISQLARSKGAKLPPQQVFKSKIVLLGHQEVGKTSVRLCFQSDPFFFKRLPDVQSTTGIEATDKVISIDGEEVDLSVMDFAGQESYHSHTLFLTQRTVFVLVWKISAVEQHFTSRGISEHEEARICRWITEVYSKFPKAPVALCATHLDELRDQSQKSVEAILNKVGNIIQNFIAKISEGKSQMPIVGNFAVSCKNRVFTGTGAHAKLAGSKMSVLLGLLGKVALMNCKADPVFWGGAIPGRHIRLIQEVQELQKKNETMLLSLSDYIKMAVKIGIESDDELLEVSQLMHSWNILYLFNQHKLAANVFIFLHPSWMCKLAGVLFSMAHVINTPLHLRSVIGGLEYGVSNAEGANMGLLETGFLRFPLVRVIFRKSLTNFLERDPHDGDMELCVQILVALELIVRKNIETEDTKTSAVETPSTVPVSERNPHMVTRYFVPSLSPYLVPETLRRLAPLLFPLGVHIKFDFSFLPDEFWWRFQHRMHRFAYPQSMACGEDEDDDDAANDTVLFQMKEARELHNYWRDGMWLGDEPDSAKCRVLVLREFEPPAIRIFSAASGEFEEVCEGLLQEIEQEMSELLTEYKGLHRHVRVECPEPNCFGFFTLANLPSEGSVQCMFCRKAVAVENICVSGSGPLGRKVFPIELTTELRNVAQRALDDDLCEELMKTVLGEIDAPVDPVRLVDDMLLAFMHREALDIAERRAAKNGSFSF